MHEAMHDTEMLSLIEHHRWRVEPLTDGGWMIEARNFTIAPISWGPVQIRSS